MSVVLFQQSTLASSILLTWVFQMCTHLSKEPLAKWRPSGLNATL